MTAKAVEEAVGVPREVLHAGETLGGWGSTEPRVVTEETWIYKFGPFDVQRFALTFRDGVVILIECAIT